MIKVTIGNNLSRSAVVISEDTTIREALENAGIDYTIGITSLDGCSLSAGQMDKTFAEMGVTEKCYLLNMVKADNAATVKVIGDTAVIVSDHKLSDIKEVAKYAPDDLAVYEGSGDNKEVVFAVCVAKNSKLGGINQFGATFGSVPDAQGHALITFNLDGKNNVDDVAETLGRSILYLNQIESKLAESVMRVGAFKQSVRECISVQ